jgi:transcriptional regulator with XRE-family HTH domain
MTRESPPEGAKTPETLEPAYYEALGRAIKVARTELGLSRKELAAKAQISYPYVADIESGRGRLSSSALLAVARALEMSPSELMARAEFFVDRMQEPSSATAEAATVPPARSSRRWFHDESPALMMQPSRTPHFEEPPVSVAAGRTELHRLIDELPDDDVPLALEIARRLLGELPARPR